MIREVEIPSREDYRVGHKVIFSDKGITTLKDHQYYKPYKNEVGIIISHENKHKHCRVQWKNKYHDYAYDYIQYLINPTEELEDSIRKVGVELDWLEMKYKQQHESYHS